MLACFWLSFILWLMIGKEGIGKVSLPVPAFSATGFAPGALPEELCPACAGTTGFVAALFGLRKLLCLDLDLDFSFLSRPLGGCIPFSGFTSGTLPLVSFFLGSLFS